MSEKSGLVMNIIDFKKFNPGLPLVQGHMSLFFSIIYDSLININCIHQLLSENCKQAQLFADMSSLTYAIQLIYVIKIILRERI